MCCGQVSVRSTLQRRCSSTRNGSGAMDAASSRRFFSRGLGCPSHPDLVPIICSGSSSDCRKHRSHVSSATLLISGDASHNSPSNAEEWLAGPLIVVSWRQGFAVAHADGVLLQGVGLMVAVSYSLVISASSHSCVQ